MIVKVIATDDLNYAADQLVQLLGGRGYMENNLATQLFRDVRVLSIGEGPNENLTLAIGRSLHQTQAIRQLFLAELGAADIYGILNEAANEVLNRNAASSDRTADLTWSHFQIGKLALYAFAWAACDRMSQRFPSAEMTRAAACARSRFERAMRESTRGDETHDNMMDADSACELADRYRVAIGDIEQQAPHEERSIDPLLRREFAADNVRNDDPRGESSSDADRVDRTDDLAQGCATVARR